MTKGNRISGVTAKNNAQVSIVDSEGASIQDSEADGSEIRIEGAKSKNSASFWRARETKIALIGAAATIVAALIGIVLI